MDRWLRHSLYTPIQFAPKENVWMQLFHTCDSILLFLLVIQGAAATHGAGPVPGAGRDGPGPQISPPPIWEILPHKWSCPKIPMHSSTATHGHSLADISETETHQPYISPIYQSLFNISFPAVPEPTDILSSKLLFPLQKCICKAVSWWKTKNPLLGLIFLLTRFPVVCRLCLMSSFQFKCSYSKIRKTILWLEFLLSVLISFLINS